MPFVRFRVIAMFACVVLLPLAARITTVCADDKAALVAWEKAYVDEVLPVLKQRCAECHDGDEADGGFDLAKFAAETHLETKADVWDQVGKRLRLNEMPPEGSPGLNDQQKSLLHRWIDSKPERDICSQLATDETKAWYRGYVMSRRLTRTEYCNAVRDLVGVSVADPSSIPSDGSGGEGFDTAGDALFTSAIHVERYLQIANSVISECLRTDSPNRPRIMGDGDGHPQTRENAAKIVSQLARRAWRRSVGQEEVERLLALFDASIDRGQVFDTAIAEPLTAILVSPNFLFVVETEQPEGGVQRLTDHQLATRLALFLWSSIPDDELLDAADRGQLRTNEQILAQTERMLADDRARAIGESFGLQWLGLTHFTSSVRPDPEVFPDYDPGIARDMHEEAVRLVSRVFRENQSVLDLIDSDQIEINGKLASHYGMDLPADANWQRVDSDDGRRGGVLTLGAVLTSASYPRRTSPVLRGRWVLEELLGGKVPPPPPGVPALEETESAEHLTQRQRLEEHRKNPACASCHNRMDPLGFGLENYDGLGRWRTDDGGQTIDASGKLPSGETFSGPVELKQILLKRSGEFEKHLSRKMLGFALGRSLNEFDKCVIEDCQKTLAKRQHRSSAIIETIVTSYPFQYRYFKPATPDAPAK
ncbi:hypothetical protein K227x_25040 [Rubripirellula lacrimiformis]|uniref:Planctomycete cytochrome C n=1 Tax=Rubripirellula lacrimiformis TaxID=1930273 RepID=A0A517NAF1_9BACT|nr:DUF1592 domain-containing protein [Rubripirellula lacrimiformis]QDT04116.1 hypothetical protein K227x_25040 [Rubripirellula lacrimiformis]